MCYLASIIKYKYDQPNIRIIRYKYDRTYDNIKVGMSWKINNIHIIKYTNNKK